MREKLEDNRSLLAFAFAKSSDVISIYAERNQSFFFVQYIEYIFLTRGEERKDALLISRPLSSQKRVYDQTSGGFLFNLSNHR